MFQTFKNICFKIHTSSTIKQNIRILFNFQNHSQQQRYFLKIPKKLNDISNDTTSNISKTLSVVSNKMSEISDKISNKTVEISNMTPSELSESVTKDIRKYDKSNLEISKEVLKHMTNDEKNLDTTKIDLVMMFIVSNLNLGQYLNIIELLNKLLIKGADKNKQLKMLNDIVNNNSLTENTIKELIQNSVKYPELNDLLKQIDFKKNK
jgi:hypothetical protein